MIKYYITMTKWNYVGNAFYNLPSLLAIRIMWPVWAKERLIILTHATTVGTHETCFSWGLCANPYTLSGTYKFPILYKARRPRLHKNLVSNTVCYKHRPINMWKMGRKYSTE